MCYKLMCEMARYIAAGSKSPLIAKQTKSSAMEIRHGPSQFYSRFGGYRGTKWTSEFHSNQCFDLADKQLILINYLRRLLLFLCVFFSSFGTCFLIFYRNSPAQSNKTVAVPKENSTLVREASTHVIVAKNNNNKKVINWIDYFQFSSVLLYVHRNHKAY